MEIYKLCRSLDGEIKSVLRDNSCIPFDPANTDAQQFAKWLQEGNRPEPAKEGGTVTDEWIAETIAKLLP
jgi:hypothetical protein